MKTKQNLYSMILAAIILILSMNSTSAGQNTPVKLFFLKNISGSNFPETVAVERQLPKGGLILTTTMKELFKGPNKEEAAKGLFSTFFPKDVADYNTECQKKRDKKTLRPLGSYFIAAKIDANKTAIIDFKPDAMCYLQNTPANSYSVMKPIEKTATQFEEVESVIYSINGKIIEGWDA